MLYRRLCLTFGVWIMSIILNVGDAVTLQDSERQEPLILQRSRTGNMALTGGLDFST